MSKLNETRAQLATADLVIMVIVENLCEGRSLVASPASIAESIGGATPRDIQERLERMVHLGVVDRPNPPHYRVTHLGVSVMEQDVEGFQPGERETRRRDHEVARSIAR